MRGIRLRAHRMVMVIGLSTGVMGLALPGTAQALNYPADGNWLVLTRSAMPIGDIAGDAPGSRDVVGSVELPMAYVQSDATHLYFRLRVNASILSTSTNVAPFGWGCVIDANGDDSNYEYSAILDGVGTDTVWLWKNTLQEMPNNPDDPADSEALYGYVGPFDSGKPGYGYARERSAGTFFPLSNPNPDYFADWAIERSKLAPSVGPLTPLRFGCAAASDGTNLSYDVAGEPYLPDMFSDPVICDELGCYAQNCAGFGTACSVGIGECATAGTTICLRNGPVCNATAGQPSAETCNSVDDDCDGAVDEGFDIGTTCSTGIGACMATGQIACTAGDAAACNAVAGSAGPELCGNDVDEDCDGTLNNGFDIGSSCSVGIGACMATGQMVCAANGTAVCNAVAGSSTAEVCGNDVDEDCDGTLDNGFGIGDSCSAGMGACLATGQIACTADGSSACNAVAGSPMAEVCGNGVDEDCDNVVDNNCTAVEPDAGVPPECTSNTNCDSGKICVEGVCVAECTSKTDCDSGKICVEGVCVAECTTDTNCDSGKICIEGVCGAGCRGDGSTECPMGEVCSSNGPDAGECVPAPQQEIIFTGGGCDCQTGSSSNLPAGMAWLLAIAGALVRRRQKR